MDSAESPVGCAESIEYAQCAEPGTGRAQRASALYWALGIGFTVLRAQHAVMMVTICHCLSPVLDSEHRAHSTESPMHCTDGCNLPSTVTATATNTNNSTTVSVNADG
jgi:hypothetical protein